VRLVRNWEIDGEKDRKSVSMLLIKPCVCYEFAKDWSLVYVSYGISVYWNKQSGEKIYFPLGGVVQRSFHLGSVVLNISAQFFHNVIRHLREG